MKFQEHIALSRTQALPSPASRRTVSSASLAGQDYTDTNISLTFSQRLFSRVNVSLGVGYQNLDYFSATTGASTARSDDYFYIEPSIDVDITRTGALAVTTSTGRIPAHLLYSVFTIISSEFVARLPSSSCSPACS